MLKNLSVIDFANETASDSPAPGGGSIAALNAAMAASLLSMVASLTMGKEKFKDVEEEMKAIQKETSILKDEFVDAIDEDANSFNGVMEAFKMPKETEEDKKKRSDKIQEGYESAIEVPLGLGKRVTDLYKYATILAEKGNQNAITDVAVAVLNIKSAQEAAFLNVRINLSSVKNHDFKERVIAEMEEAKLKVAENHEKLLEIVDKAL